MATLDLSRFGFDVEVELGGHVSRQWLGANGLVILFAEMHRDYDTIARNLLDCCKLVDAGIVACAGVEDRIHGSENLSPEQIKQQSLDVFKQHGAEEQVISFLLQADRHRFRFGRVLSFLRPDLPLRWVEDPDALRQAWKIENDFTNDPSNTANQEKLSQFIVRFRDHPIQRERERGMVENLIRFWDGVGGKARGAAILNSGSAHTAGIACRLENIGTSYVCLSHRLA